MAAVVAPAASQRLAARLLTMRDNGMVLTPQKTFERHVYEGGHHSIVELRVRTGRIARRGDGRACRLCIRGERPALVGRTGNVATLQLLLLAQP